MIAWHAETTLWPEMEWQEVRLSPSAMAGTLLLVAVAVTAAECLKSAWVSKWECAERTRGIINFALFSLCPFVSSAAGAIYCHCFCSCCGFSCNSCCDSQSCLSVFHCICVLSEVQRVLVSNFRCHSHFNPSPPPINSLLPLLFITVGKRKAAADHMSTATISSSGA